MPLGLGTPFWRVGGNVSAHLIHDSDREAPMPLGLGTPFWRVGGKVSTHLVHGLLRTSVNLKLSILPRLPKERNQDDSLDQFPLSSSP